MKIETDNGKVEELQERIDKLELENARLRSALQGNSNEVSHSEQESCEAASAHGSKLSTTEIERYSRQLLLHGGFGVEGQLKLLSSSVLVIGAGGIGSTVIPYLAASGFGKITIVDFDNVEISNLHRQVIHKSRDVGMNKADSAFRAVKELNPTIECETVKLPLTTANALELVSRHDCIVDACDNPQTRYLVNDACVLAGKPLVSGSAIGSEGQLTVYNYKGGPCYRCLYPKPNAAEGSKTCSDNGVLGPVPGLIGVLEAVEAIKVVTGTGDVLYDRLAMYDSLQASFLRVKKPPRQPNCPACGPNATIRSMEDSEQASSTARGPSCGIAPPQGPPLPPSNQITCPEYESRRIDEPHVLLDVRVPEQFELCSLAGAINIPLESLPDKLKEVEELSNGSIPVYCICRRGIASTAATKLLSDAMDKHPRIFAVKNIQGGLDSWRAKVDSSFPRY